MFIWIAFNCLTMSALTDDFLQNPQNKPCELCQKPALHRCAGCSNAYYCNKQHQRDDWKRHRNICKPFKMCEDTVLGRHLIATRELKPGDVVIREPPLIWGPSPNTVPVCLGCGKGVSGEDSRPCSKCGWPVCGELCEKAPAHIPECRYTAQRGERVAIKSFGIPHPTYRCIPVLRCLYQKQFLPKVWKRLEKLEAHCDKRKSTKGYENDRVMVAEFIRRFFKLSSVFSEEDIMTVYGMLLVNSHEVPLSEPSTIAVYGTTSMLEHSCTANCAKSFTAEGHVVITVAKRIAEGEHLSICYTDPLWGTPNRRYFLHETKYFWCRCARCEDPTEFGTYFSALKCQNTNCGGHVLPATFVDEHHLLDWVCDKCGNKLSSYSVHDVLERFGRDLYDLDKTDVESCKNFLSSYKCYLSENHFYSTDVEYVLTSLLGRNGLQEVTDEDLALKLECCKRLEGLLRIIAPAEKRVLGTVLFEEHAALAELARRKGSTKVSSELLESRKILMETIFLLKDEPDILPEGKICKQARQNLTDIDAILQRG